MTSLMGECFGVVKNSISTLADDENCYWKSGDQNYKLAVVRNDQVAAHHHLQHRYTPKRVGGNTKHVLHMRITNVVSLL